MRKIKPILRWIFFAGYIFLLVLSIKWLLHGLSYVGDRYNINWDSILKSVWGLLMTTIAIVFLGGIMAVITNLCESETSKFRTRVLPYVLAFMLSGIVGWHFSYNREYVEMEAQEDSFYEVLDNNNTKGVKFFIVSLIVTSTVVWFTIGEKDKESKQT